MTSDYRSTCYCPKKKNFRTQKIKIQNKINTDHKRAIDMHNFVSKNNLDYKLDFIKAYNCKCAYCGVSSDIIPKESYEIDHFIYKESFSTKAAAGKMANLVLACHVCNHRKGDFAFPLKDRKTLHPDYQDITKQYIRDQKYYIKIAEDCTNKTAIEFYETLGLGDELRRLDYLLMNIYGLSRKLANDEEHAVIYQKLGILADTLRKKRNIS